MSATPATPATPITRLMRPDAATLPGYVDALQRGWSADNVRGAAAAQEELAAIARDAGAFLASRHDPDALGGPIPLPDGSVVPRLPGYIRWMLDGDGAFCGSIGLRWQRGTPELPPYCLGHIGYAVVPWQRQRGHATRALALLLQDAWALGLPWVELTTDEDNLASQRVITACGGVLRERFVKQAAYGGGTSQRWRITRAGSEDTAGS